MLRILCTCSYLFIFLCCSQFLLAFVTCTDDPHRLKRVLKSQVRSQLIYLSIVELIVDVPQCFRILEQVIIDHIANKIPHGSGAVIQ